MDIIQVILEFIIILIVLYMAFLKSYFKRKGKNLATKEDIEELTQLAEAIKQQLHLSTQTKLSLQAEERNALINNYERYNYWLHTILDIYFGGINKDNKDKLREYELVLNEAKFAYEISDAKKDIFVNSEELDAILIELKTKTLELQFIIEDKVGELEYLFVEIEKMFNNTHKDQQLEEYAKLLENKSQISKDMNQQKLEKYKEIATLSHKFKEFVYNHLRNMNNEE